MREVLLLKYDSTLLKAVCTGIGGPQSWQPPYVQSEHPSLPNVAIAVRTLLVGGYDLDSGGERQPGHIEIRCQKPAIFGLQVQFLIAITDAAEFNLGQMRDIEGLALQENRKPVFVGRNSTDAQLGWQEFLLTLGGEVPSWRAVAPTYSSALSTTSTNNRPAGTSGEAWLIFEDLVCDGLEFSSGVERTDSEDEGADNP